MKRPTETSRTSRANRAGHSPMSAPVLGFGNDTHRAQVCLVGCILIWAATEAVGRRLLLLLGGLDSAGAGVGSTGLLVAIVGVVRCSECFFILCLVRGIAPQLQPPLWQTERLARIAVAIMVVLIAGITGVLSLLASQRLPPARILGGSISVATWLAIGPLTEEILFRGVLYSLIRGHAGIFLGAVLSALLFGGVHSTAPGSAHFLQIVLGGVGMALIYERFRSIWVCAILHGGYNSIMLFT